MAASPPYKIYNPRNEYIGAVKYAEDAAVLVGVQGEGATIRYGHTSKKAAVWTEGKDGEANESWDAVAMTIHKRLEQRCLRLSTPPVKEPTPTFICVCCGEKFDCMPHVMDGVEGWLRINGMHSQFNKNLIRLPTNNKRGE